MSLTSRLSLATGQPYDQVANKVTSFRKSLEQRFRGSLNAEKSAFRFHLRLWPSPSLRIHMGDASPSSSPSSFGSFAALVVALTDAVARSFYGSVPSGYFALSPLLLITKVAKKAECIIPAEGAVAALV